MSARRRVAVIGGGVTGLTAALALIERPGDELDVALY
jgi:glycine/D-amino acid oxidase-like deaminating enzyme